MDPPIHTEYFLSGGAMILIFMVDGARAVISFCILSAIPGYMVVPPDSTVLAYRSCNWVKGKKCSEPVGFGTFHISSQLLHRYAYTTSKH